MLIQPMKLLEMKVEGYRSLKSISWTPGDVNVLIGPNASGKTNLLKVLELLSDAAAGRLGDRVRQEGGMGAILWDTIGSDSGVRISFSVTAPPEWIPMHWLMGGQPFSGTIGYEFSFDRYSAQHGPEISYESMVFNHLTFQGQKSDDIRIIRRDSGHQCQIVDEGLEEWIDVSRHAKKTETLLSLAVFPFPLNEAIAHFRDCIGSWAVHRHLSAGVTSEIRRPAIAGYEPDLSPSGDNLIQFLHTHYSANLGFKSQINEAMKAAFADDFLGLEFPPASTQRIELAIRWRGLRTLQKTPDLSDGTLRFLFLIAALSDPTPPSLIAIEEPEVGLHPGMLSIVAEYAFDASERSQVVFTTHSTDFLDAFREQAPTVTAFELSGGATVLSVLSGDRLTSWMRDYGLGELQRSSELEDLVKEEADPNGEPAQ